MDLFRGMKMQQREALRKLRSTVRYPAGSVIFSEGDPPASGIQVIVEGEVRIFRQTPKGEVELARLGPPQVFGEMALLSDTSRRTASARAAADTTVMQFASNPPAFFEMVDSPETALILLQNLIGILAERLRSKDRPDWVPLQNRGGAESGAASPDAALAKIREAISHSGPLNRVLGETKLKAGAYLCRQGDEAKGFYFIHEGELEVRQVPAGGGTPRVLGVLKGPTVAGEIGFFTKEKRTSSLAAKSDVRYDFFSGNEFQKLAAQDPAEAFEVLFAVAKMIVCLILERENG
ncbi:cyclic nucleotide-binding domain-containing protein [Candidatus Sumerlaeota bacterium]|nr:cyclic nucleotide-binding domain-containing protein [Candidatus Sumerlaeota bacterium]